MSFVVRGSPLFPQHLLEGFCLFSRNSQNLRYGSFPVHLVMSGLFLSHLD